MTKYELSISANYVPSWGIVEAVRELFQNALDEETKDANNKMFFDYDNGVLCIGNKNSTLDIQSLLVGTTAKQGNDAYIGQHGEGYKLATIVLLRSGHGLTFYNYNAREIWRPRFVKSRKYNGALVPTFFVERVPIWDKVPEHSLVIEVSNVSPEEYEDIKNSNLHLQEPVESLSTSYGSVLLDKNYRSKVYVEGLYVCDSRKLEYGYDFKPAQLKLDRDRRLVDTFNLLWQTSLLLAATRDISLIQKCLKFNDGSYLQYGSIKAEISDVIATNFKAEYGLNAVPVSTHNEFNEAIASGLKAIMVSDAEQSIIKQSLLYADPAPVTKSLLSRIQDWYDICFEDVDVDHWDEFSTFLDELEGVI